MADKTRLTLDLEQNVHEKLKIVSARKRTSMREYCTRAIVRQLSEEAPEYLTAKTDPVLAELWDNDDDAAYDDL